MAVPVGLQFVPANEATQTMIAAGGETITVPVTTGGAGYTTEIQAFCGQFHDGIPSPEDVFNAGEMVTGQEAALVTLINRQGAFGRDQQEAIWQVTDGYDISGNAAAAALVEQAAPGSRGPRPRCRRWTTTRRTAWRTARPAGSGSATSAWTGRAASPFATKCPRTASRAPWSISPSRPPRGACRTPTRWGWRWRRRSPTSATWPATCRGACGCTAASPAGSGASPWTCSTWPAMPASRAARRRRTPCAPNWAPACSTWSCRTTRRSWAPAWR